MKTGDYALIAVAFISGLAAYLAQRSASKASTTGATVTSRLDAEKEAYERARAFDLQTIERQDAELRALRSEVTTLRVELARFTGGTYGSPGSGLGGTVQPGDH